MVGVGEIEVAEQKEVKWEKEAAEEEEMEG